MNSMMRSCIWATLLVAASAQSQRLNDSENPMKPRGLVHPKLERHLALIEDDSLFAAPLPHEETAPNSPLRWPRVKQPDFPGGRAPLGETSVPAKNFEFSRGFGAQTFFGTVDTAWTRYYGSGLASSYDLPTDMERDALGNVYVTGYSTNLSHGIDYLTVKYNSAGVKEWEKRFNGPDNGDDYASAIAVDKAGNIYVTGYSQAALTGSDYVTIKYNSAGAEQWVARYAGPGTTSDAANDLAVDDAGNVYVTGSPVTIKYNQNGGQEWFDNNGGIKIAVDATGNVYVASRIFVSGASYDYAVFKYSSAGVKQWVKYYNGPGNSYDYVYALAVDAAGNVYVTGESYGGNSNYDYATVKYNTAGVEQWAARYNGPADSTDGAAALAVDNAGNVYVTGRSRGLGTSYDYATVKYNSAGAKQWEARYNGSSNSEDVATDLNFDAAGNVYVTGYSYSSSTSYDFATIKYNSTGVQQWIAYYASAGGSSYDIPYKLVADNSGNIVVTGYSYDSGTGNYDYATIKYASSGAQQWVARYNGPGNSIDRVTALAADAAGNVYVTGYSRATITGYDYATLKYNREGILQWAARYAGPGSSYDTPYNLAVDNAGNVYVTGNIGTVKYDQNGAPGWFDNNAGIDVAVDAAGNVYVINRIFVSGAGYDYATIKYNSAGVKQWVKYYNGPGNAYDYVYALAVDAAGNAYVTGSSNGGSSDDDYATVKYNTAGVEQWVARYNGPADSTDTAFAIAVDNAGNVYVTGRSRGIGTSYDYATVKYNSAGAKQWDVRYNSSGNYTEYAYDLAVDANGNVYATGDAGTIKYNKDGTQQWIFPRYGENLALDLAGNVYTLGYYSGLYKILPNGAQDWFAANYGDVLAVDLTGNVYVAGTVSGRYSSLYVTTKYIQDPIQPPLAREIRLAQSSASPGRTVDIPITLAAQGNENALGFSLSYDPNLLGSPQAKVGKDASSAALNTNSSQAGAGRFGVALALSAGQTFVAGLREIVVVTFTVNANTTADSAQIVFGDQPIAREVVDAGGNALSPVTWKGGSVIISRGLEADLAPRPNGDGKVTISDWVLVGRIVAGLDTLRKNTNEFQRADCGPKPCGDGRITISDWVQAGRYAAGLDSVVRVCGPTSASAALALAASTMTKTALARTVQAINPRLQLGQTHTVTIVLESQGDENALGFSVGFDTNVLTFINAALGNGISGATLNINSSQTANGLLGIALALPAGQNFAAGARQLVNVNFSINPNTSTSSTPIAFKDQPIAREVVDVNGNALLTTWSAVLTSIKESANEVPARFALGPNHPNPFNPSTVIKYDLPQQVEVKLVIFDMMGRHVRTLVNGIEAAGYKSVNWDGKNSAGQSLPSGVYLYRITADKFSQTRRMTLLK